MPQRFILTGAPGAGKTALIRLLESRGEEIVEEAATDCPEAAVYAPACVHLLSAAGIAERGRILRPDPVR